MLSNQRREVCRSEGGAVSDTSVATGTSPSATNAKSKLSFFGGISSYFKSEWSFAQYKLPDVPSICAFTQEGDKVVS